MRKILIVLFVALFGFSLSGCGEEKSYDSTGSSEASKAEVFLASVEGQYSYLEDVPDSDMIELASVSCEMLDNGGTRNDIVNMILGIDVDDETGEAIAFIIGAGVAVYCPEHTSKIS